MDALTPAEIFSGSEAVDADSVKLAADTFINDKTLQRHQLALCEMPDYNWLRRHILAKVLDSCAR